MLKNKSVIFMLFISLMLILLGNNKVYATDNVNGMEITYIYGIR
jgi:hypothetical protein